MNPQDRHPPDRSLHVQASSRRAGSSSPADTRSNAASGLTQQGLANQRPYGERHDPSSEMQPGSSRDGHPAQQGSLGTAGQVERHAARQGVRPDADDTALPSSRDRYADAGDTPGRPRLDPEDPEAARDRS